MKGSFDFAVVAALFVNIIELSLGSFGKSERVLLNDIKVLTLHHGQMTSAQRSRPIPQLKCLGGSAQCSFTPQTVQCYNKGSDGYDVQWECKTDMDSDYRFGQVEVSCEGYDYQEDPYVLRGSCGLEYTIDYTKSGYKKKQHHHHDYYGHDSQGGNSYSSHHRKGSSWMGDLITLGIVGLIIYGIYKTCINTEHEGQRGQPGTGTGGSSNQPPPPGFRPEYSPKDNQYSSDYDTGYGYNNTGYGSHSRYNRHRTGGWGTGMGGGGFWGGAATGGILGYLLGNRGTGYGNRGYGGYGGNSWGTGGGSWGSSGRSFSSGGGSSGSRTASGFGGTSRR